MKRLFLGAIVITILLTQLSLGDNVTPLWTKTYNGATNGNDYGMGIAVDISGNIYVTGYESVTGQGTNIWTRKYDNNGSEVWTRTYNGVANGVDMGSGIAVDISGNVYVTGSEEIAGHSYNIWTRKYDSNGSEVWTKTYNGNANGTDVGSGITVDSSGNIYVTGYTFVSGENGNIWTGKYGQQTSVTLND